MNVINVRCDNCAAPLEMAEDARFVTCRYCGTELEVRRSASAVYTKTIGEIAEHTRQIAEDVDEIRRQNAVEQLDREWELERETLMISGRDGSKHVPTRGGSIGGGAAAIVMGIGWSVMTGSLLGGAHADGFTMIFPLFGLVFAGVGLWRMTCGVSKAQAYERAQQRYEQRRVEMLRSGE